MYISARSNARSSSPRVAAAPFPPRDVRGGTQAPEDPRGERRLIPRTVRALLLPLAAGALVYLNSLGGGFVYDDNQQILDNPWVHDLRLLPRVLTHTVWAFKTGAPVNYYRPVQMALYSLLWSLSGGSPFPFHLASLLLHLGVVAALFFLALRLSRDTTVATAAALLFAVHPLNTATVAWAACVPEQTYALFGLLALLLQAKSWEATPRRKGMLRLGAVVLFLLALFSKETALVFLLLVSLMDGLLGSRAGGRSGAPGTARARRGLVAAVPYACAAVLYLAIRGAVVGGFAPMRRPDLTAADALLNAPLLLLKYVGLMAAPVRLLAHHVLVPLASPADPAFLFSLVGVAMILLGLAWLGREAPDLAFAAALALLPILPVLYLPAVSGEGFAERYTYLPTAGLAWLVAGALSAAAKRLPGPGRSRLALVGAVALLATTGAAATVARNPVWRDDGRLASVTLRDEPRAWQMHVLLGNYYERRGRMERALRAYEEGLGKFPDNPQLMAAAVNLRLKLHRIGPDEAIRDYLPLARSFPSFYEIQFDLGDAFLKAGRAAEAEQAFRRAVALNPAGDRAREGLDLALIAQGRDPEGTGGVDPALLSPAARSRALLIRGIALMEKGRLDEAGPLLQEALRLDPKSDRALLSLAVLEFRRGDDRVSMDYCRKALVLDPGLEEAYQQMGISALRLGDLPEAIRDLERATGIDPRDKGALTYLGVAYARAGRREEARRTLERALALDPAFEKARHNLERLGSMEAGNGK